MPTPEKILKEMDNILKELLFTAEKLRTSIEKKLEQFEKLNTHFIENLSSTHSVFEKKSGEQKP